MLGCGVKRSQGELVHETLQFPHLSPKGIGVALPILDLPSALAVSPDSGGWHLREQESVLWLMCRGVLEGLAGV